MNGEDIFKGLGVEITLNEPNDFLKVKETLTRIGVASKKDDTLYQSCHILHKKGRYVIIHFKELFKIDGKESNISEEDIGRRNTIANLLSEWGLLKIVDPEKTKSPLTSLGQIKILQHDEKKDWQLVQKYTFR